MKKYNLKVIALYSLAVIVNIIFIFKYFPLIKLQSENIYNYITEIIEKYPELKEMFGYGFTIKTLDLLLGTPFLITCVCIAQSVMLILAIKGFYRLASSVIENRYLLYLAMIIFATHPSLGVYGGTIVTDSFAMAGLIFFISNYRKIMLKPEKKAIFPIVFNMFFLSFLRSTLLFLIPVGLVSSLYMYLKKKNNIYIGVFAGSLFILFLHIGVAYYKYELTKKENTYQSLSLENKDISNNNTADFSNNNEIERIIDRIKVSSRENLAYSGLSDLKGIHGVVFREYFKIPVRLIWVYIMMFFYLIYIAVKYYHSSKYNRTEILIWGFVSLCIILMIYQKGDQFSRMIMPVVPLILILSLSLLSVLIGYIAGIISRNTNNFN